MTLENSPTGPGSGVSATPASQGGSESPVQTATAPDSSGGTESLASNPEIRDAFARFQSGEEAPPAAPAQRKSRPAATPAAPSTPQETQQSESAPEETGEGDDPFADGDQKPERKLDPLLRQAARRSGWSDEEIDEFVSVTDPTVAEKTFGRMLQAVNTISAKFGQLGSVPQEGQQPTPPQQQAKKPATAGGPSLEELEQIFSDENIEALRGDFGSELIDKLVAPLRGIVPIVQQAAQFFEQQQQAATLQQINQAFDGLAKDFQAIYGDNSKPLEDEHRSMRLKVCQLADRIASGAAMQGVTMSIQDAIEQAHMIIASEQIGQIERQKIKNQLQKRQASLTSRTSSRSSPTQAKSDAAAMQAYQKRMAELGL